jgi:hypothetical protein
MPCQKMVYQTVKPHQQGAKLINPGKRALTDKALLIDGALNSRFRPRLILC